MEVNCRENQWSLFGRIDPGAVCIRNCRPKSHPNGCHHQWGLPGRSQDPL